MNLSDSERERLLGLGEGLRRRVVGQDHVVEAVAQAVIRSRLGLGRRPKLPTGPLLFLGPTGVGKTKLVRALAEQLFDDDKFARINMGFYKKPEDVDRLIGVPPSYVGTLTDAVRTKPYVFFLDAVERAHPSVLDTLLQVLGDDKSLTRIVDFSNTVIIMSSNLGAEHPSMINCTIEAAREMVMQEAKKHFNLNKFDEVMVFDQLSRDHLKKLCLLQLKDIASRLAERYGIPLGVTEAALDVLSSESHKPIHITRRLDKMVATELSHMLYGHKIVENSTVYIDASRDGKELSYHVEKNGGQVNAASGEKYYMLIDFSNGAGSGRSDADQAKKHFKPEMLNKLDKVMVFDQPSHCHLKKLCRLQLKDVASGFAKSHGIALGVSDAALDVILSENYEPIHVQKMLKETVVSELSEMIVRDKIVENSTVYIDASVDGKELIYRVDEKYDMLIV